MANKHAAERTLKVGEERYTLCFNNSAYAELEDVLEIDPETLERRLEQSGLSIRLLRAFLWAATRKYHRFDLPGLLDIDAVMDELGSNTKDAYNIVFDAYIAAQPPDRTIKPRGGKKQDQPTYLSDNPKPTKKGGFDWRGFLESAVKCGLKPDEFWDMTPDEVALCVDGWEHRYDMVGNQLAHFWSIFANSNRKKSAKKLKAKDLWNMRRPSPDDFKTEEELIAERMAEVAYFESTVGGPRLRPHRGNNPKPPSPNRPSADRR